MYIPKHFSNTDRDSILEFIRKYSFGLIVSAHDNIPVATHLPFLIEERNGEVVITSHLAKANPQADQLRDDELMVVFSEPHAYVSPQHYEKEQSVPTWNYIAVHAYGKATIIDTEAQLSAMMGKMIAQYDTGYLNQWNNLPAEFKTRMYNGIVAFEIRVTSLQAKNKLSQNRSENERKNIIEAFEKSNDVNEVEIAGYMKKII
jgi:transcriptional regulator